ncbi:MAG: NADH-quinone oxidoreductase subunit C [Chloroflexi bacterium]|nr:NADH-quinone oxidoreductase subunit C [Chloroflexota bacterium]
MSEQQAAVAEATNPIPTPVVAKVREQFGEQVLEVRERLGETTIVVRSEAIVALARFLRDHPDLAFNHLSDVTAVDYLNLNREPRFDVVYHFYSIPKRHRLRVRAPVPEDDPTIATLTVLWPGASFPEREVYDLFGIQFAGHPDLTRILMPDDWVGHPLRKDYPIYGEEIEFSHNRETVERKTLGYG